MDATSLLLWKILKLPTAANFRFPYASTSPADFWNRRWNLPVSHAMRALIYEPLLEGRLIKPFENKKEEENNTSSLLDKSGSSNTMKVLRRALAVVLVFSVSGLMHETMYWYITGHMTRSVLWLRYFIFSGLLVLVENAAKQPLRRGGVQIPTWIQWIVTQIMRKISDLPVFLAPRLKKKNLPLSFFSFFLSFCAVQKMMEMWWVPAEESNLPNLVMQHVKEVFITLDQLGESFVGVFNYAMFKLQEAKY